MSVPTSDQLEDIWAEVPSDYYFNLNALQRLWHEWKWLVLKYLATLDAYDPKTILEVGCAGGHLSGLLAQLFPEARITGVDVYAPAIKEAKKRFPQLTFKAADAHSLPFKTHTFDLVLSSETIEHVVDPAKMLGEIARVMKPGGKAIVEMDSGSALFRLIWFFWTRWGRGVVWKNAHLHPFSASELECLIKGNGFIIKRKILSHFGMAVSFLISHNSV